MKTFQSGAHYQIVQLNKFQNKKLKKGTLVKKTFQKIFNFFRSPKTIKVKEIQPRMYLILREDLKYKYIQGAHCLAEYALFFPEDFKRWNNSYLICLSVFNGLALDALYKKIRDLENFPQFAPFFEPDLKSELPTSICIFENGSGIVSNFLSDLKLASF